MKLVLEHHRSVRRMTTLGLLRVNHQVKEEASRIFWGRNTWQVCNITDKGECGWWSEKIQSLRHLAFQVTDDPEYVYYVDALAHFQKSWSSYQKVITNLKSLHIELNTPDDRSMSLWDPNPRIIAIGKFAETIREIRTQFFNDSVNGDWTIVEDWPVGDTSCLKRWSGLRTQSKDKTLTVAGFYSQDEINFFLIGMRHEEMVLSLRQAINRACICMEAQAIV